MPELLRTWGGYYGTFGGSGGVCRNFWGLRGGYAGTFEDLGGGVPELLRT